MKEYQVVRCQPVAKFYYAGSHSHPVRRTVLVTKNTRNHLTGYELREGVDVRHVTSKSPVKTYCKNKIACFGQCRSRLRKRVPVSLHERTTLERQHLLDLVRRGV